MSNITNRHILPTTLALVALALTTWACTEDASTEAPKEEPIPISKEEAAAANGKSDSGLDFCELFDWYGDQICDTFCAKPDPDCGYAESFEMFKVSSGGFCPPEIDCSSFTEIHADGTLRADLSGDLTFTVHEVKLSQDDLDRAIAVLTSNALIDLLSLKEEPCPSPTDVHESMAVTTQDATYANTTTFCDKDPLPEVRDLISELINTYVGSPELEFEGFRASSGGFCPPELDCNGFVEIDADGGLRVDKHNDLTFTIYEAKLSPEDLEAAIEVLTDPALVELLAMSEPPCVTPTDVSEFMTLDASGQSFSNMTTFCHEPPLDAVRALLEDLTARYTPEPEVGFTSFTLFKSAGPCPPDTDCSGRIELLADGTLLVDRFGELPVVVHEATVTPEELEETIITLTDAALIELLSLSEAPCVPPSDIFEQMELETSDGSFSNSTTFCDDAPLQAARDALNKLVDTHLPAAE